MIKNFFSKNLSGLISDDSWIIEQTEYCQKDNLVYETNFALTNGYMCIRGSHEEETRNSLPCTYLAGIFDKSEAFMMELANTPNFVPLKLYVERNLIGIEDCEILEFKRALDMKKGILFKRFKLRDIEGKETLIEEYRFVSRDNLHRAGSRFFVTPLNYSGIMEMEQIIDGTVLNFKDFPRFRVKHTETLEVSNLNGRGCYVECKTRDRDYHIGTGSVVRVHKLENNHNVIKSKRYSTFGEVSLEFSDFDVKENETIVIDRFNSIYTEREVPRNLVKASVDKEISDFIETTMEKELQRHIEHYEKLWYIADIKINGDELVDKALRFNIFHLMSTANKNDNTVSLGAKLLHGEEYGGHTYWDTEIFMLPFFAFTSPDTARTLLEYRYNLLPMARKNAIGSGYRGAKYPWESADDGTEQCPAWTIEPDGSCYRCYVADYEHHITADVAFGIYNYFSLTGDIDFMLKQGAEIILETARFWVSRCIYNSEMDRYEIPRVTGPDEWHEPVDNNCYTNYLARWNIGKGFEMLDMLKKDYSKEYDDIVSRICLIEDELKQWQEVYDKIYIPFNKQDKLMEQFEGYFKLPDFTISEYDENDMPIIPEEARKMGLRNTCINKQADVVMLMFLLPEEFDDDIKKINYDYYEKRTSHRSSLSPSIFSIMGLKIGDHSMAYKYLKRSALVDLHNNQGNTREGFHAASSGGTWQSVMFGFAGMGVDKNGMLYFKPWLPEHWGNLEFKIYFKENLLSIKLNMNSIEAKILEGPCDTMKIKFNNEIRDIAKI
ncbi:kojibiose phosphorylase [Hathewaya proteolytica DSM 3090]|uniref:Kojibiose phosphorylase n=1 Tax=Hathewaya proteolytica DSM 3090 TaxID=1121331 RepID=A0A1M6MR35_9CLOT|nr:glycosyl hydrolase family 65 protein [Hathewaya proteolytica]SHJ85902.1 kojibiose phosphorylase [Hathewaya proteolytica DSM 3090]